VRPTIGSRREDSVRCHCADTVARSGLLNTAIGYTLATQREMRVCAQDARRVWRGKYRGV